MKPKLINKKLYKLVAEKCRICKNDIYEVLDVHRLEAGGRYSQDNTVVICTLCHRKHHSGIIKIDKWYHSTNGNLLRWIDENNEEHFS